MTTFNVSNGRRSQVWRRISVGLWGSSLVLALVVLAGAGTFSNLAAGVKQTHALAVWYVHSGQLRADAANYVTHVEFLFFPQSGAGARLDLEVDE